MMDYMSIARQIFAGAKYRATEDDISRLAANMALLETRGLGKLNQRLIDSRRGVIWATIAEHNFAVILVSRHASSIPIHYEPEIGKRPPDFKIEIGDIIYWIQMKDLAKLERENRQDKIIQKIKLAAREIKIGKFFSCMLSDDFKEDHLPELIDFIRDKATTTAEEDCFYFIGKNNHRAKVVFWSANKLKLSELTLGTAGDLEVLNITALDKEQIRQSLLNAAGAFEWEASSTVINLIAMEADGKEDIDICDALFGTEYEMFNSIDGHLGWSRKDDGLFKESEFSKKVAGIIATKRKKEQFKESELSQLPPDMVDYSNYLKKECGWTDEKIRKALEEGKNLRPIVDYYLVLYINDRFTHLLEDIKKLFPFDKIVYYNMRPPINGNGDFELS